ncbi:MAG: nitronate monooxygenase, partial [Alphaproteobacteria bacterium]|nr:nitronate monooxygenase [Alphaproteobacteria bacterium]
SLSAGPACAFADKLEPMEAIYDRLIDEAVASSTRLATLAA